MKTTKQFRNKRISMLFSLTIILFPFISKAQLNLNSTGGVAISGATAPVTGLNVNTGNINLSSATNAYQINGVNVLGHNNVTTNMFVGVGAGNTGATGGNNCAFGNLALNLVSTNGYCSAFGTNALKVNTTGGSSTACGWSALVSNTTGNNNTAFGLWAGNSTTTGSYNTFIGTVTGTLNTTGSNNTSLGYNANVSSGALTNATAIGHTATVNASNKVRIGNSSVTVIEGQVAWTSVSDGRFKNNIKEEVKGLEFIKKLRPVSYQFDAKTFDEFLMKNMPDSIKASRSQEVDYTASSSVIHTGFIAQEVEQAAKDCHYNFDGVHLPVDDNDNYGIAYSQFVVPLVKAVQELSGITDSLGKVITKQDSVINAKNAKVDDLQNQISNCCSNIIIGKGLTNSETVVSSNTTAILYQNNPNPFNQQTNIQYSIPTNSSTSSIMVFDLTGKLIKTIPVTTFGNASITINGNELNPGMFVYSLIVDGKIIDTKSMILTH